MATTGYPITTAQVHFLINRKGILQAATPYFYSKTQFTYAC